MSFHALELHPTLLRGVEGLGYARPTPIQTEAIPPALAGRDVLACAATGSGKTAAFLLPILHQLLDRPKRTTRALIIAPTRELAQQIVGDFGDLARFTGLRAAAVHGGVGMGPQEKAFRTGTELVVATPGRLLDHFRHDYAALKGLEWLVLDEADRMLDMGFLPDIRRVLAHIPRPKQILFFSATMPAPIAALTREILRSPVNIALQRGAATPSAGVTHAVYPVRAALKAQLLVHMLQAGQIDEALVFTRTKHRADRLTKHLTREGISADRIHGNRSQAQRNRALAEFKAGGVRVLVATDIAARGIDVEALGHVVNFDVPVVPEDYVHRVGRTARAGATGEAYTLAAPEESADVARIERAIGSKLPRARLEGFAYETALDDAPLEIPLETRIAAIRAQRASHRAKSSARTPAAASEGTNERGGPRRRRFGRRRG
ncbi:MAG: DEAD/DEAH box helicase [Gemmatimonadales bacterium]